MRYPGSNEPLARKMFATWSELRIARWDVGRYLRALIGGEIKEAYNPYKSREVKGYKYP